MSCLFNDLSHKSSLRNKMHFTNNFCPYAFKGVLVVLVLISSSIVVDCDKPLEYGRHIEPGIRANVSKAALKGCGSNRDIAARIGYCMQPTFDLVLGRHMFNEETSKDEQLLKHCESFAADERCIRGLIVECLTGLHKSVASAVANSMKRFRLSACKNAETRVRYIDALKCAVKVRDKMTKVFVDKTGQGQFIRDIQNITPEQRFQKICCLLIDLDRSTEVVFGETCPASTSTVSSILHAITDDARSTLCFSPKCNGVMDKIVKSSKYTPPQNIIEPIFEILLTLNKDV